MIPNPIRKVLSSMRAHRVGALLMGGQACVFYGAAEFSRDTDFALLAEAANLTRLRRALNDLDAAVIAIPVLVFAPVGIGGDDDGAIVPSAANATPGRSVIKPSTPACARRRMAASSFTVHAFTR